MPPIDPIKVANFVLALNTGLPTSIWIEVQGINALMKIDVQENGNTIFQGNAGFPVKGFLNTQTGEVRLFSARIFTRG